MNEERQTLVIVPTELERRDAILDFAAFATPVLVIWWVANQYGWHTALWFLPVLPPVWIWALSGEPLADMQYIGAVASGVRNIFGWRRAHEWLFAFGHYWQLAIWPVWHAIIEARLGPRIFWRTRIWFVYGCPQCYTARQRARQNA